MTKNKNEKENKQLSHEGEELLSLEYKRLTSYINSSLTNYDRRFDIYLGVFSASFAGIITTLLSNSINSLLKTNIIMAILLLLLIIGITIFIAMLSENIAMVHYERAIRLIQQQYINNNKSLNNYLYYRNFSIGTVGSNFKTIIFRGLTLSGLKTILGIMNCLVLTIIILYVTNKILLLNISLLMQIIIVVFVILFGSILHVAYATFIYKVYNASGKFMAE